MLTPSSELAKITVGKYGCILFQNFAILSEALHEVPVTKIAGVTGQLVLKRTSLTACTRWMPPTHKSRRNERLDMNQTYGLVTNIPEISDAVDAYVLPNEGYKDYFLAWRNADREKLIITAAELRPVAGGSMRGSAFPTGICNTYVKFWWLHEIDLFKQVTQQVTVPDPHWADVDNWYCPDAYPIDAMTDKHLWETLNWIVDFATPLFRTTGLECPSNANLGVVSRQWLAKQPKIRKMLKLAETRGLSLSDAVAQFVRSYIISPTLMDSPVYTPWRNKEKQGQQQDLRQLANMPVTTTDNISYELKHGRPMRRVGP